MLDIKFIRSNPEIVKKAIKDKQVEFDLEDLLSLDGEVAEMRKNLQELQTQKNQVAKMVPKLAGEEKKEKIEEGRNIGQQISKLNKTLAELEDKYQNYMWEIPNIPAEFSPIGESEEENKVIKTWGEVPKFDFAVKNHAQILQMNGWGDFEKAAKVSGSRGYMLQGDLVFIEMALHQLVLKKLKEKQFNVVTVPSFARDFAFYGTGHFPKGIEQMYFMSKDDLYLTGTSEIIINSLHKGEILKEDDLPYLYGAYGPCYRREAGSAGKDVGGLMRVHQFNKTEQYIICKNDPEESLRWHQFMLDICEELLQLLKLPYRIVECCTGDMGLGKYRMNDIETWVPSEGRYRETHSCSTIYDWQARRTNLRYRNSEGKTEYCHTLNCTALATPRLLIPLIENHQREDGSVNWPLDFFN